MAQSVASAPEADTPLLFEAGTGVGKSRLPHPGLLHAIDSERPFIVSSHTIAHRSKSVKRTSRSVASSYSPSPRSSATHTLKQLSCLDEPIIAAPLVCRPPLRKPAARKVNSYPIKRKKTLYASPNGPPPPKTVSCRNSPQPRSAKSGIKLTPTVPPAREKTAIRPSAFTSALEKLFSANCIVLNHSLLFSSSMPACHRKAISAVSFYRRLRRTRRSPPYPLHCHRSLWATRQFLRH